MVVAIIAVLAALLLPALKNARDSAGAASCLGNARQVGLAFAMYLGDWGDKYPIIWYWRAPEFIGTAMTSDRFDWMDQYGWHVNGNSGGRTWKDGLWPYLPYPRAWNCPKQKLNNNGSLTVAGYTMNSAVGGGQPWACYEFAYLNGGTWVGASQIKNPPQKVLIGCAAEGKRPDGGYTAGQPHGTFYWDMPRFSLPNQWNSWPPPGGYIDVFKHKRGCPVIFCDSHGEIVRADQQFGTYGDVDKWLDITK